MFTVLSKTRNSNLSLIAALAVMTVVLLTFAVMPAISAPESALVPVTGVSAAGSDYYGRHPELRGSGAIVIDTTGDFFLRHAEWAANGQNVANPLRGISEVSDYFQRHPELSTAAGIAVDTADYFLRHPQLHPSAPSIDLSDYFLRH